MVFQSGQEVVDLYPLLPILNVCFYLTSGQDRTVRFRPNRGH